MELNYINTNPNYKNLRDVLIKEFHISKKLLVKLKNEKSYSLNNGFEYLDKKVSINDTIKVNLDFEEENSVVKSPIPLNILFEDESMVIVNKPAFIPVHPSLNHYTDSLSNGVSYYFDKIGLKKKIRVVNRLDINTSGIVIFAKNQYVQEVLKTQKEKNQFEKTYIAILSGFLDKNKGTIEAPISRKKDSIIERMVNFENGIYSKTYFELLKNFEFKNRKLSLVKYTLETGRTHQLRIHSKYIGHPILGDTLYGDESDIISRQALHAYKISFIHPISKDKIEIVSKIPDDMMNIIKQKRKIK